VLNAHLLQLADVQSLLAIGTRPLLALTRRFRPLRVLALGRLTLRPLTVAGLSLVPPPVRRLTMLTITTRLAVVAMA
jgi:hypothetical protein